MLKHLLSIWAFCVFSISILAQDYNYSVDLVNVSNDKIAVELKNINISQDEVLFNFPKTIPGTYATQNYGVYIDNFKAFDREGRSLKVKKSGENTFAISGATELSRIQYYVNDSWDSKVKKNKIFEPAGTNWEKGENFVFNNAGIFGYFQGEELKPFKIEINKPASLYGLSVLATEVTENKQMFKAKDYHQLVDCPILFAAADTAQFKVLNTSVTIGVYSEFEGKFASKIYDELKESMQAIAQFVGKLPVENYSFLIYLSDQTELGAQLVDGISISAIAKLAKLGGVGALEHGNSSFYYLVYMGDEEISGPLGDINYIDILKDVAIHEFMHIFTPLNLHSEHIGNFNYTEPVMSKHLWLYEGITEYFAGLIQLQAGIISLEDYFNKTMKEKVAMASRYPYEEMSFTEMSENVLEKPYSKQYMQVYQRGAVMGLLLDLEIARLTNGQKTLKDVVITLGKRYGADKSFDEEAFIKEFVAEVHPDLQLHFDKYVTGKEDLPINEYLARIGLDYNKVVDVKIPQMPYESESIKLDNSINARLTGQTSIKKVMKDLDSIFQKGDKFNMQDWKALCYNENGALRSEGANIEAELLRNGEAIKVNFPLSYKDGKKKHHFEIAEELTEEQQKARAVWMGK